MSRNPTCTIYVGNLPVDVREQEIEDLFYKYGRIVDIELKLPPRPPGFCFVEFEDARDAEDAIEGRNGYKYEGNYLRVELAHGGRGPTFNDRRSNNSSGRGAPIPRRAEFRVFVSKLPQTASWQDLKDHMRKAGDVSFAQVFREGGGTVGIVDYTNHEDMKYAIRKLDDSEFRNRYSRAFIRVQEDRGRGNSRRSYSPRSRRRSYSRSPSRSRSRSPSRSNAGVPPARPRSLSASRSRSKSPDPQKASKPSSSRRSMSRSQSPSQGKLIRAFKRTVTLLIQ
ncbi:hypothetical protein KP509_23G039200 [Ceratopteris richardii]|uniref:RRM domain-containing protein n=1 Tax=Ceratopteris richardii TaxID=49495 RepID=A0A8T2S1Z5_CERRI|nr:hypothetical protein KP509_23G039200 [Ceratopteris richardii]